MTPRAEGWNPLLDLTNVFWFGGTGEPAWGWAQQKWATEGGGRSPQEEGTAARPGWCWASYHSPPRTTQFIALVVFSAVAVWPDSGWEWGAEGRSLWSDRSTQFSSRGEPETPCQTGEPRAGPKGSTSSRPLHACRRWCCLLTHMSFLPEQHMREVAERRQQLELEHEQALAILKFKQDEIKRLQRVRNPRSLVPDTER